MPELPEVEVVRLFLESKLIGKTISKLEILTLKSFIGNPKKILGQKITGFTRLGKQLSIHLQNESILLFHLKMTGQIIYFDRQKTILGHPTPNLNNSELPNKSTRLIFTFSDHSKLYFNDQRKFGWVKILTQSELNISQKNLGLDIFDPKFTPKYLHHQLQTSSRAVKLVLLDQSKFAGIGNIYANDVLFLAKIHPSVPASKISLSQSQKIHQFLLQIMSDSIRSGGSTAKDNKYVHPDGSSGQHQFNFQVYQRSGEPCLVCKTLIKRIKIGGRGTFFCPKCQK